MEAEAEAGSGTFSVEAEAEARKIHLFYIEGKNGEREKNWFCYPSEKSE